MNDNERYRAVVHGGPDVGTYVRYFGSARAVKLHAEEVLLPGEVMDVEYWDKGLQRYGLLYTYRAVVKLHRSLV